MGALPEGTNGNSKNQAVVQNMKRVIVCGVGYNVPKSGIDSLSEIFRVVTSPRNQRGEKQLSLASVQRFKAAELS